MQTEDVKARAVSPLYISFVVVYEHKQWGGDKLLESRRTPWMLERSFAGFAYNVRTIFVCGQLQTELITVHTALEGGGYSP